MTTDGPPHLRRDVGAAEGRREDEPERTGERVDGRRLRVPLLVRRDPRRDPQRDGGRQVGDDEGQPHLGVERLEEVEQAGGRGRPRVALKSDEAYGRKKKDCAEQDGR